jgi:hypothetical protein
VYANTIKRFLLNLSTNVDFVEFLDVMIKAVLDPRACLIIAITSRNFLDRLVKLACRNYIGVS